MVNINLLAVLVAGIVHFIISAIWYSPFLFLKPWLQLTGQTEFHPKAIEIVMAFFCSLIIVCVLAVFIVCLGAAGWFEGLVIGLLVAVGLIAPLRLRDVIFEKMPFQLFLIRIGYNALALAICGVILTLFSSRSIVLW